MARGLEYKDVLQQPLNGKLDVVSLPDQMPDGAFRFRLNMTCSEDGRVCRAAGWNKFLSHENYGNQDLHDQLIPLAGFYDDTDPVSEEKVITWPSDECVGDFQARAGVREVPTLGLEVQTTFGTRRWITATQSRIYVLNETVKNYRIIGDGYGGPTDLSLNIRFYAAVVGDNVFFTNNYDIPCYWPINQENRGCAMRGTRPIADLDEIGLTKASSIVAYKGSLMLGNVVISGQRYAHRIVWSDYKDGTSFDPEKLDSITGFFDLDEGEVILEFKQIGSELLVFTKTGIWVGSSTGSGDSPFTFQKSYGNKDGDKCLAYRNSLVSTGGQAFYAGIDGFYIYDTYKTEPESLDWVDDASVVFKGAADFGRINQNCCDSHVAGFRSIYPSDTPDGSAKGEIWFSWAESDSCLPSKTIVFNTKYRFASLVDYGFSFFSTFTSDQRISLRDWILENCFCTTAPELEPIKEPVLPEPECPPEAPAFVPESIFSETPLVRYGITTEDWEGEADEDSLCALLGEQSVDDLCNDCNQDKIFIGCSTQDLCLKQIGTTFNRERCSNSSTGSGVSDDGYASFAGTYVSDGYYSILISEPKRLGTLELKNVKRLILDAFPVDQISPCVIFLRVGYSHNAYNPLVGYSNDPNDNPNSTSGCGILWKTYERKLLTCPLTDNPADLVTANLNPWGQGFSWPVFVEGKFIYWSIVVASLEDEEDLESDLVPALGGECCFTSMTIRVRVAQRAKL